jgi:hypothetical protein
MKTCHVWSDQMSTGKPPEVLPRLLREPEPSALIHGEKRIDVNMS